MNIQPDPVTPWRLFAIIFLVLLVYVCGGAATYKSTKYRLTEKTDREVSAIFWPIYWIWRGVDKVTWWAEPTWAGSGPE